MQSAPKRQYTLLVKKIDSGTRLPRFSNPSSAIQEYEIWGNLFNFICAFILLYVESIKSRN